MKDGDDCKFSFNTQEGHYKYLVIPFGLCNVPAVFQPFMNIFKHNVY